MAASADLDARSGLEQSEIPNMPGAAAPDRKPALSRPTAPDNSDMTSQSSFQAIHRLDAGGSVQALVVDDEVLIAGLQGGQIAVRGRQYRMCSYVYL